MNIAFLTLLLLFSPFSPAPPAHAARHAGAGRVVESRTRFSVRDRSVITRLSMDFRSGENTCTIRIHTAGGQPLFSEPTPRGTMETTLIFYDSAFSEGFSQADAAGPVMAYNIGVMEGDIVLRVSFISESVVTYIFRDSTSNDILIRFTETSVEPVVPQSPGFVRSSTDDSFKASSGTIPPTPTDSGVAKPVLSFREALLSATRQLSRNKDSQSTGFNTATSRNKGSQSTGFNTNTSQQAVSKPTKSLKSAERWHLDTIVLDAGHGGWDEGAVSRAGLKEKDLSLSLAKILGRMVEKELGIHVEYTRTSDVFIPLAERGRIANSSGGKLFISIHANQSRARSARGTETYFLGIHRSDSARVVMERENKVVEFENDADTYLLMNADKLVTKRLTQSAYLKQSEKLAALIQTQFTDHAGRKNRGVKQAGFYVLFGASMPSVLVELGFLSNNREADYLRTREGQVQMARAIFQAISLFKDDYEKPLNVTEL